MPQKENTPFAFLLQEGMRVVEVEPRRNCPFCDRGKLHAHGTLKRRKVHHQVISGGWILLAFTP